MDVARLLAGSPEPQTTAPLQAWVATVRARLSPAQRTTMERWFNDAPFDVGAQQGFRQDRFDAAFLAHLAHRLAAQPRALHLAAHEAAIAQIMAVAHERPAVASAFIWHLLGASAPELASNLVQAVRERAGLPGLRARITSAEHAAKPNATWFDDRHLEDAAAWAEHIPTSPTTSLADAIAQTEAQRAATGANIHELVPFVQQLAGFLVSISTAALDPLGFPLSRDAQLVADPPLATRMEIATWARTVRRSVCLRGQMLVLRLGVHAPWPLSLEVIACELGRGVSGAFALLLRLRGELAVPPATQAPVLLCLPGEPIERRGARFERWAPRAYVHAVDAWRGFA